MPVKTLKKIPHVTRDKIALILVCIGFSAFGAGGVAALTHLDEAASEKVGKAAAEESCEKFGNTLRLGLREYFNSEIKENEQIALFEKFFPDVPRPQLEAALQKQNARLRYNVKVRFKDVPCDSAYTED